MSERMFPIQTPYYNKKGQPHPTQIPWSVAEKAYSIYAARYGRSQTLERLAERGGFCPEEMDEFHPTWRDEASEITMLRQRLAALEGENADLRQRFDVEVNQQVDMETRALKARLAQVEGALREVWKAYTVVVSVGGLTGAAKRHLEPAIIAARKALTPEGREGHGGTCPHDHCTAACHEGQHHIKCQDCGHEETEPCPYPQGTLHA